MEQDLPADSANATLIAYLQQMLADPKNPAANPKKLVGLVALFEDDDPRLLAAPGLTASNYPPRVPGTPMITGPQAILREDLISATSYIEATGRACQWVIIGGRHKIVC